MEYSLDELAERLGCRLVGEATTRVRGVCVLNPGTPNHISFLNNSSYKKYLNQTRAAAVILSASDVDDCALPALVTANPYLTYARVAALFQTIKPLQSGTDSSAVVAVDAVIDPTAQIGPHVYIGSGSQISSGVRVGPGCVIGANVRIGSDSQLVANVYLGDNVVLGQRVALHPGVVIGADGFGFAQDGPVWVKVPQLGSVRLGDDVDVGANTTIDRGAIEDTVIESGVKLDNQIQIAHNVRIGANTVIAGCVGIAGSTIIGQRCQIGGGVGISGHLEITNDVYITGMTMVTHSLLKSGLYSSGIPVDESRNWRKNVARFRKLDDLARAVGRLEKSEGQASD